MATDFGRFSTYQASAWIDDLSDLTMHYGLAGSDPFIGDPLAAEVIGGSYGRQLANFALAGATALEETQPVLFTGLVPGVVIAAIMVFDARFAGNMISAYVLADAVTLADGGSWGFGAGDYVMGLDVAVI